ncbi:MAG: M14 metallopeptidase family protein [Candidatus Cyclobacteriaceae bacterium M3_2C_046]
MIKRLLLVIFLLWSGVTRAQESVAYFFSGKTVRFDPSIPSPEQVLGYQVGQQHVSHESLVHYLEELSSASDRMKLEIYGHTYENRPLLLLKISSPENINQIDQIQVDHLKVSNPDQAELNLEDQPVVVWMGYSVHGNEASGGNAALLVAYYLAAAQGQEIEALLDQSVVLLDPCINPDGFNRYAHWANAQQNQTDVADPLDLEHNEYWPGSRTNHYWFDLNRDWLPVQHPESQGRIKLFQAWKPNVVTDHHEMGTNSTFFFQPGIPSRNHPLTPESTYKLTRQIAEFHARALDQAGTLYYTRESFDDFYYGKGSTYPDINGGVGILFEQASSRGKRQQSENGILTFPFTIKNQVTTSLSTLEAAGALKEKLLIHQADFYKNALKEAENQQFKGYLIGGSHDRSRLNKFIQVLHIHQVKMYELQNNIQLNNTKFTPENSILIPLKQPQYKIIQAIFEKRTDFEDSLFYDISAWSFPHAFGLPYVEIPEIRKLVGPEIVEMPVMKGIVEGGQSNYAYIFKWDDYSAPKLLYHLQCKNLKVKVLMDHQFKYVNETFKPGSIMIPVQVNNQYNSGQLYRLLDEMVAEVPLTIYAVQSGQDWEGIDLGSPSFSALEKIKLIMPVGEGVSAYEAGEVWHLLDQRFSVQLTRIPMRRFSRVNLSDYNTMVLVNGNYSRLTGSVDKIKSWIQQGGNVVAWKGGVKWLSDLGLTKTQFKKKEKDTLSNQMPYRHLTEYRDAQEINGAIFSARVDLSHPVAFGMDRPEVSLFKDNTNFMIPSTNNFANPVMYTKTPLVSGYISDKNLEKLKNTAAVSVSSFGQGRIISFSDNPNFRAFWYGTNRLFLNSLFFAQVINLASTR